MEYDVSKFKNTNFRQIHKLSASLKQVNNQNEIELLFFRNIIGSTFPLAMITSIIS